MYSTVKNTKNKCFEHSNRITTNIFQDIHDIISTAKLSENCIKEVLNIEYRYNEAIDYKTMFEIALDAYHLLTNFIFEARIFYGYENSDRDEKLKQHDDELQKLKKEIVSIE